MLSLAAKLEILRDFFYAFMFVLMILLLVHVNSVPFIVFGTVALTGVVITSIGKSMAYRAWIKSSEK